MNRINHHEIDNTKWVGGGGFEYLIQRRNRQFWMNYFSQLFCLIERLVGWKVDHAGNER